MTIISANAQSNGAYANQHWDGETAPEGYLEIPEALLPLWEKYKPFVELVVADGTITAIEDNVAARAASTALTIEQVRTAKLAALNGTCSAAIVSGVTIDGKRYTLTSYAQINLSAMSAQLKNGQTTFLYHADDEAMTTYTAAQITAIAEAASSWVTVNTAYYDLLKTWVGREADVAVLEDIKYGSALPSDLTGELATLLKAVGIETSMITGFLTA